MTTTELIAAVCSAGGLGMLQGGTAPALSPRIEELEQAGATPFGVNFVPPLGQGTDADVDLAASRARLVEFFTAIPTHAWSASSQARHSAGDSKKIGSTARE